MLKTDYSEVAKKYDQNKSRVRFEPEPIIDELLQERQRIRILDLGCGTANYIHCQNESHRNDKRIEWVGVDPSSDMLAIAEAKESDVTYVRATAEELPFPDGHFDFIVCNFVYHHFERKAEAFDQIKRCLREDGVFKLKNIAPEFMEDWWVFHFCPETRYEDLHRFWPKDLLVYELEKRGFKTAVKIDHQETYRSLEHILEDYARRDTSELAMIGDAAYGKGLERLRRAIADGLTEYRNVFALIQIEARFSQADPVRSAYVDLQTLR